MKPLSILLAGLAHCVATHSAHAKVQLKKSGTKVEITVDGEAFAVFNFGKEFEAAHFFFLIGSSLFIVMLCIDSTFLAMSQILFP